MKKPLLFIVFLLITFISFAQETVKRKNDLNQQIEEQYNVLKSDKQIRQGEYTAVYKKQFVLARGNYTAGKRTGSWEFFTYTGKHIQTFDYDKDQLTFIDSSGRKGLQYYYGKSVKATDSVEHPIPVGGYYYCIFPFITAPGMGKMIAKDFPNAQKASYTHIFTISGKGELIKHEVMANVDGSNKMYVLDDAGFDNDMKKYIPAMVNHHPVESKIYESSSAFFSRSFGVSLTPPPLHQ